ncbi:MAG: leucine-rich repeat domain-containing protein, partial [Candidatus Bipolaricaulota bacterium]
MFERNRARSKAKFVGILLIISVALVFNWTPLLQSVLAEAPEETDSIYFEFDKGSGAITGYDTAGGREIIIPAKIAGVVVKEIGTGAFYKKELTSVRIPEGVVVIGTQAFQENNLTSVKIPDSVKVIGDWAFAVNELISVEIPFSVEVIGDGAFGKNKLTALVIGSGAGADGEEVEKSSGLKEIGKQAFQENQLTSVELPDSMTVIGDWAFSINDLTSLEIPSS